MGCFMKISENNIRGIQAALKETSESTKAGEKKYLLLSRSGNQVAVKPKSEIKELSKLDFFKRVSHFVKDKLASILSQDPPEDDLKLATFSEISDLVEGLLKFAKDRSKNRLEQLEILNQYEAITQVYKKKERTLLEQLFFLANNQSERAEKIIEDGREEFNLLTEEEIEAQKATELKEALERKKKNDELNKDKIPSWIQDDPSDQALKTQPVKVINNNIYEGVAVGEGGFKGQIHFCDFKNRLTTIDNGFFIEDKLEGEGKREEMANLQSSGGRLVHFRFIYEGTFKDRRFVEGTISTLDSNGNATPPINYPFPANSDSLETLGLRKGSYSDEELKEIKFIFDSGLQGYIQP